ncbi:MAG: gliding motility-associated C-terminal domain-containing protein [Candidatus Zixiibacteriota bacterium]
MKYNIAKYIFLIILAFGIVFPAFAQDTIPPIVRPHVPSDGAYSSCSDGHIVVYIYDVSTIYRPSLFLTCWADGHVYELRDSVVSILDTLFYFPYPDSFENGTELSLLLAPVSDMPFGNTSDETSWSFTIDTEPPFIDCVYPALGTEIAESYPDLSFIIVDSLSGLSEDSSFVLLNGDTIPLSGPGVTIEDSLVTISLSELGIPLPGGDSVFVDIHGADNAVLCGANTTVHSCYFTVEPGGPIRELVVPYDGARVSCPDTGIVIRLQDENGILDDSLRLIIDDTDTLYLGDSGLSFDGEFLRLPTIPYGIHDYELIAYDSLFNPLETPLEFQIIVDTEPPVVLMFEPDTSEFLHTLSPTIRFELYDSIAGMNHSPTLVSVRNGTTTEYYTLSGPELNLSDDIYQLDFDGGEIGLRGGDTLKVCIIAYDSIGFCSTNGLNICFELVLPFSPPVCSLLTPPDGSVISCDDNEIRILATDEEGIYFPSIMARVSGESYYPLSPELSFAGDTILYNPSEPWRHGERVDIEMTFIEDILRNASDSEYSWSFQVDLEGPRMVSHIPRDDELVVDSMTSISLRFREDLSGIDSTTLEITVDGEIIVYPDPRLSYFDNTLTYTPISGFDAVDTVQVCFTGGEDMPYPICPPNDCETCPDCWTFFIDAREPYVTPPEGVISACDSQTTQLVLWSPLGIDPSTIELQVNDILYTIDDSELWFDSDTMHFGPGMPWNDGDTVECLLIHADDGLTDFDSIGWTFYIDLTKPAYTALSPLPEEIITIPDPVIEYELHDSVSGIDSLLFEMEVAGSHYDIYSEFIDIDDGLLSFDMEAATGGVCGGDTIEYCVYVADNAYPDPYCGPNVLDTCIWFAVEYSPPEIELLYPDTSLNSSCETAEAQQTRILITDENGIPEDEYEVHFNGDTITLDDPRLELHGDTLIFQPETALENGDLYEFILQPISDNICNQADGFAFDFLIDTGPPVGNLIYPRPSRVTSDIEPVIQVYLDDSLSEFGYNLYIDGMPFEFDSIRSDTGFYRHTESFGEQDSIIICVSAWDSTGNCPANADSFCFFFLVDAIPPTVYPLYPDSGSIVSCPAETILCYVEDISSIDPASIEMAVNGVSYDIASSRLRFINDTLIYIPSSPWEDGDTVIVDIINVSDIAGNSASEMGILNFIVDLSTPYINTNPEHGETVYMRQPALSFTIDDDIAGVDSTSLTLFIMGEEFTYPGPEYSIEGDSIRFDLSATDIILTAGDSACFCLQANDLAENCAPNGMDTCICITLPDTPPEVIGSFPEDGMIVSCADSMIHVFFDDDEGLSPEGAEVSLDGTSFDSESTELTILDDELQLSGILLDEGLHEFCINHIEDELGSVIEDLPYCIDFTVDITPPAFTPTPPIGERISNPAPIIEAVLTDIASAVFDSILVEGIVYGPSHDAITITADTIIEFDPIAAGIDTLDTTGVDICLFAHDTARGCGFNYLDTCYSFEINLSAPVLTLIMPFDGAYSSCPGQQIRVHIYDGQGVDTSSIEFNINGTDYDIESPELEYFNDTLIFTPTGIWPDETLYTEITAMDILGNEINPPFSFTFYIDTIPPEITETYPADWEYIPEQTPILEFTPFDALSGFDYVSGELWLGDTIMFAPEDGDEWNRVDDSVCVFNIDDIAMDSVFFFERDTVRVSLRNLTDSPDYCDQNIADDYDWQFIIADDDTSGPEIDNFDNDIFCGDYFHIQCDITDYSGIEEAYAHAWYEDGDTIILPMSNIGGDRYASDDSLYVNDVLYYIVFAEDADFDNELPEDRSMTISDVETVICSDYRLPLSDASTEPYDTCIGDTLRFTLIFNNIDDEPAFIDSVSLFDGEFYGIIDTDTNYIATEDSAIMEIFFAPVEPVLYEDTVYVFANGLKIAANTLLLDAYGLECINEFSILPTPFTPNDDGTNDELIIQIPGRESKDIYFFDTRNVLRRKLSGTEREFYWDGKDEDGRPCEAGTYIYLVKVGNEDYRTGVITLAR